VARPGASAYKLRDGNIPIAIEAHRLASRIWPSYVDPCSRPHFTLPQLFARLVVREMLKLSYRKTEALLRIAAARSSRRS
jgi:hypothetical protein